MNRIKPLELFDASLADINFIEASAGTGKTYTITGLYLRLVVEAGCPVNRILVVTYTNAATEELRDRIRRHLVKARKTFLQNRSDDAFCRQLLVHCETLEIDRDLAIRRLTNAIRGFDEAAIFTIHGFCQRVLADTAFESGMPFETELLADQREILQEIVDDFWRRELYQTSPLLIHYLLDQGYSPETLLQEIRPHLGKPYLKILGPAKPVDFNNAEQAFSRSYDQAREIWRSEKEVLETLLLNNRSLNANQYRKTSIPGWLALLNDYLTPERPHLRLFDSFEKFTARHLASAVKKGQPPPEHAFFQACDALQQAHEQLKQGYHGRLLEIRGQLLAFCNRELEIRKRRKRLQAYDDLLINLRRALTGEYGRNLAETIRSRYPAALIDEFQDTDPIQYAIFHHLYAHSGLPVFLVGDPKQAIYSFRGADIFAYLTARHDATEHYTLNVNWRSDPQLIQAINTLFEKAPDPFLFQDIPFQTAVAADTDRESLSIRGNTEPALRFWFLGRDESDKPTSKGQAAELAARTSAAEIARLLNLASRGEARLGERLVEGGDIAVLVRNHRQGRLVRQHLLRLGVPSIQQAQDNVFASREALELHRLLTAVAEPGREAWVRAALSTEMLGMSGEEIHRLSEDEQIWEKRLDTFHDYHLLWREHGFIRMFRELLRRERISERLLSFRDGERRLTNLLHLAELLQTAASRSRLGMEGLLKWLVEHRQSQASEDEEQQLRLESDEQLVKIVTIHKSKGLEYPIVFCPFLWDGRLGLERDEPFSFHDPVDSTSVFLDLGSDRREEHAQLARNEEAAENLRLLYVALTRAKYRCYLVWGAIREAGNSAPAWLLHSPTVTGVNSDRLKATAERFRAMDEQAIFNELKQVAQRSRESIHIAPLPEAEEIPYRPPLQEQPRYSARPFQGAIQGKWRMSSFTALTAGFGTELPDYDVATPAEESETTLQEERTIYTFPRGARAGSCLHLILERLDFTQKDREKLTALVKKTLQEHGLETEWTGVVADMIERVIATPLMENGLKLSQIPLKRRLNELEFYYPLAGLAPEQLRRILTAHGLDQGVFREVIENLDFNYARGYMKGFIDLVFEAEGRFYLVDYKSNWLGKEPMAYQTHALAQTIARESYYLQYLIYTVALHRYLRLRLPDYDYARHFGGVFYLFLRGMDPARGLAYGIYQDHPRQALIETLDSYFQAGKVIHLTTYQ